MRLLISANFVDGAQHDPFIGCFPVYGEGETS